MRRCVLSIDRVGKHDNVFASVSAPCAGYSLDVLVQGIAKKLAAA
jgi:hypothetical protein